MATTFFAVELGLNEVLLRVGSISTANGSSLIRWGETTIVCGVKAEIAEPDLDRPSDGWIGLI